MTEREMEDRQLEGAYSVICLSPSFRTYAPASLGRHRAWAMCRVGPCLSEPWKHRRLRNTSAARFSHIVPDRKSRRVPDLGAGRPRCEMNKLPGVTPSWFSGAEMGRQRLDGRRDKDGGDVRRGCSERKQSG